MLIRRLINVDDLIDDTRIELDNLIIRLLNSFL